MQMFLMNLAQSIMGLAYNARLLKDGGASTAAVDASTAAGGASTAAGGASTAAGGVDTGGINTIQNNVIDPIVKILDAMLTPILIIVGTAGSIYAIILGVNFAKAESADKREEAKKRMINAIIALVVTIILLIVLKLFTANADAISTWIQSFGAKK